MWFIYYVKCYRHNKKPVHQDSGDTGIFHLLKVTAIPKTLFYHYKDPRKFRVL